MKNIQIHLKLLFCLLFAFSFAALSAQGVEGNRNVIKQDRGHSGFSAIEIGNGVDLYLEQGDVESVTVKADENLADLIKTRMEGNTLVISTGKMSIRDYKAFAVHAVVKNLERIDARSGSDIYGVNTIRSNKLEMVLKGGSDIEMELETQTLHCQLTGGSDADLKGAADHLIVNARGGSDLRAKKMTAKKCELDVGGGSDAYVNVKEELDARASGASDIYYTGNPSVVHEKAKGASDIHSN